jgi:hypothetical protein
MPRQSSEAVPQAVQLAFDAIVGILEPFCSQYLNKEYAALARKLAAALARKRPSPLTRGKPAVWAGGILHALGMVNFLFDPSQKPHIRSSDLSHRLGVNQNSVASKSKLIRSLFKMYPFDHHWCLPSRQASTPMVWYIMVNGYIVDAREMPRDVQVIAFEKGLIPYVPADQ